MVDYGHRWNVLNLLSLIKAYTASAKMKVRVGVGLNILRESLRRSTMKCPLPNPLHLRHRLDSLQDYFRVHARTKSYVPDHAYAEGIVRLGNNYWGGLE